MGGGDIPASMMLSGDAPMAISSDGGMGQTQQQQQSPVKMRQMPPPFMDQPGVGFPGFNLPSGFWNDVTSNGNDR